MTSAKDLVTRMAADLGMMPAHLQTIIRTAPLRYKKFHIRKRSGGMREVAQPAREVKAIQRWLVRELEPRLPIHAAATAYREGSSIRRNAENHVRSRFMLKLDFQAFFPSIVMSDVVLHLSRYCSEEYDSSAVRLIAYVCCWTPDRTPPLRLCIGAPSSPLLSNSVVFDLDERLSEQAASDGVAYTRYADDITFSCNQPDTLKQYPEIIQKLVDDIVYPRLKLNDAKTVFASRRGRRVITGLVLTPDYKLSVGRDRKRLIRAMHHRKTLGKLTPAEEQVLAGLVAFVDSIEPGFGERIEKGRGQ